MGDVLVLVRDCEAWQPHVRYAADLAAKLHCSINGIFVSPSAIPVPADASPAFAQEIIEIYREECERAQHAGPAFARWAAGQGIRHATWRIANGSPAEALEVAANWHDLVVLTARPEPFGDDALEAGSVLVGVGLPCIVVPSGTERAHADTIAIAWNGSPQSARAVHAALPLLRQASRVVILRAGQTDAARDDAFGLGDFLDRHRLHCEHVHLDAAENAVGAAILAGASEVSANLLVMGAYAKARFSEWIVGGVTRHVLRHAALPLFMCH